MSGDSRMKQPIFGRQEVERFLRGSAEFLGDENYAPLERCFLEIGRLLQNHEEARQRLENSVRDLERDLRERRYKEFSSNGSEASPNTPMSVSAQEQEEEQVQELLHKIAEAQMREADAREQLEKREKEWDSQRKNWEKEKTEQLGKREKEWESLQKTWEKEKKDLDTKIAALSSASADAKKHCDELSQRALESKQREERLVASESVLKKTLQDLTEEMSRLQNERKQQEETWHKKEQELLAAKAQPAMPPQAQGALLTIGRSMNEMTSLLNTLRSAPMSATKNDQKQPATPPLNSSTSALPGTLRSEGKTPLKRAA